MTEECYMTKDLLLRLKLGRICWLLYYFRLFSLCFRIVF